MITTELPYRNFIVAGNTFVSEYHDACKWIDDLGLPYHKSRFKQYRSFIENSLAKIKQLKTGEEKINELNNYLNAYAEASELIRLKNSFSTTKHKEYIDQLKRVTSGQIFRNSKKNDSSRDFAFELATAARFLNAGYKTSVNQITDVETIVNDRKVFIECKRIKSVKKIKLRVQHANEQLKRRLDNDNKSSSKGIVAINVTEILNPNYNFVVANSAQDVKMIHSQSLEKFVIAHEQILQAKATSEVLGIICEYNLYGYLIDQAPFRIINCRGIKFFKYTHTQSYEMLIKEIVLNISNHSIIRGSDGLSGTASKVGV